MSTLSKQLETHVEGKFCHACRMHTAHVFKRYEFACLWCSKMNGTPEKNKGPQ